MVQRPGSFLIPASLAGILAATLLWPASAFGQISFPGQYPSQYPGQSPYPGGGIGGIRLPGQRQSRTETTREEQSRATTIAGLLRKISEAGMAVESDDKRIVTVALAASTKYYRRSGDAARNRDLQPGDHVTVEATQDDKGYFHAKTVTQVKKGTTEERAAASQPVDDSPIADGGNTGGGSVAGDDDRPRLKRSSSPEQAVQTPATPDLDDAGPPKLRTGVSRGDVLIERARDAAFSFAETLPNYMVKQFTTRYQTEAAHGGQTSWHALDTVTADVVSEGGKESYKNILVNGKTPKEAIEKSGTWSTGEFASVLLDVFSPATDTDFHNKRSTMMLNRAAFRYDFAVEQANSHWHVYSSSESYRPEYSGAIWIDKENARVLRIELSARNMPRAFALDTVESAVDYDYVPIGDGRFLLPVHSEALSCERGTSICSRNVIDFRNYRKFGADTSVTFDATAEK